MISRRCNRFRFSLNIKSGIILVPVFLIWICPAIPLSAQETVGEFTANLDEHIPGWMNHYDVPGVTVALIRKGDIIWSNAYGYADIEQGTRMTVETVCLRYVE